MKKIPNGKYSKEFRIESARLVIEEGLGILEAARRLSLPTSTLATWLKAYKKGTLSNIGKNQRQLSEQELEISRLKRELATVKMERDLLKKAAAYFAKESHLSTR